MTRQRQNDECQLLAIGTNAPKSEVISNIQKARRGTGGWRLCKTIRMGFGGSFGGMSCQGLDAITRYCWFGSNKYSRGRVVLGRYDRALSVPGFGNWVSCERYYCVPGKHYFLRDECRGRSSEVVADFERLSEWERVVAMETKFGIYQTSLS